MWILKKWKCVWKTKCDQSKRNFVGQLMRKYVSKYVIHIVFDSNLITKGEDLDRPFKSKMIFQSQTNMYILYSYADVPKK